MKDAYYKTLDNSSVVTSHIAKVAIKMIDGSFDYAINESDKFDTYL